MAAPNGRIEPGQALESAISARAWNRAQDAADIVLGVGGGFAGSAPGVARPPFVQLPCRNTSGADVPRFGVLSIGGTLAIDAAQLQSLPVLNGIAPTAQNPTIGIATEPIADGKIGMVALSGVVPASIEIKSADHWFAKTKTNSTAELETVGSGGAAIVWKPAGTGTGKLALVALPKSGGEPIRIGKTTSAWSKNSLATVTIHESGTPPNETAGSPTQTIEDCVNKFGDVASGKWVSIAMAGNGRWYLIAAEC